MSANGDQKRNTRGILEDALHEMSERERKLQPFINEIAEVRKAIRTLEKALDIGGGVKVTCGRANGARARGGDHPSPRRVRRPADPRPARGAARPQARPRYHARGLRALRQGDRGRGRLWPARASGPRGGLTVATEYVVLRGTGEEGAWNVVASGVRASNDTQAIREATVGLTPEDRTGTFVAVPLRSFRLRTRTVETKEVDRWA